MKWTSTHFATIVLRLARDQLRERPELTVLQDRTLDYLTITRRGISEPVTVDLHSAEGPDEVVVVSALGRQTVRPVPPILAEPEVPRTRPYVVPSGPPFTDDMVEAAAASVVDLVLKALDGSPAPWPRDEDYREDGSFPRTETVLTDFWSWGHPDAPLVRFLPMPLEPEGLAWWLERRDWPSEGIGFTTIYGRVVLTAEHDASTGTERVSCTARRVGRPSDRPERPAFGAWDYDKETGTAVLSAWFTRSPQISGVEAGLRTAVATDLVQTALDESGVQGRSGWPPEPAEAVEEVGAVIPLMQDGLVIDLLGWDVVNELTGSTAELADGVRLSFAVRRSRLLGPGIQLRAAIAGLGKEDLAEVTMLSTGHAHSLGRWRPAAGGLEYSAFLSHRVLHAVSEYPVSRHFLSTVVTDLAATVALASRR